jgi:hypothetical protein
MSFIPAVGGTVSIVNSAYSLVDGTDTAEFQWTSGTAQANNDSLTSIKLATGASASNDTYTNYVVEINSGKGQHQFSLITDYVGATRVATVSPSWGVPPDATSTYIVHLHSGQCPVQTQDNSGTTMLLSSDTKIATDDVYNDAFLRIVAGQGAGELHLITDYDQSTGVVTLVDTFGQRPNSTSLYVIYGEGGTVDSATSTTLVPTTNLTSAQCAVEHLCVEIVSGTGVGQIRNITSGSSVSSLNVDAWTTTPTNGAKFVIYSGWGGAFESVKAQSKIKILLSLDVANGEHAIVSMDQASVSDGSVKKIDCAEIAHTVPTSVHVITPVAEFFRLRVIGMGSPITGDITTSYHTAQSGQATSFINQDITKENDCALTRSVLTGESVHLNGGYTNVNVNERGQLSVSLDSPQAAFGEVRTVIPQPVAQLRFLYGLQTQVAQTFSSPGTVALMMTEHVQDTTYQVQRIQLPKASLLNQSGAGSYFTLDNGASSPAAFYVWFDVDSGNTDPTPGGTGIQVDVGAGDSATQVAAATQTAVDGNAHFSAAIVVAGTNLMSITLASHAATTDPASIDLTGMPTATASTFAVTKGESMLSITNGDGIADYAIMRSRRSATYRPGQGVLLRMTAVFDAPTASTRQYIGLGNDVSGLYIGYNGTQFGILHRTKGMPEVRTLTMSGSTSSAADVTITLDGVDHTVALGTGLSAADAAASIANGGNNFSWGLYEVEQVGADVIFIGSRLGAATRTFAFADTGSTGISGSFATTTTGAAATDTVIRQEDFFDRLDGYGKSGMAINPQTGNVFLISLRWLGFGGIEFFVENPASKDYVMFHRISYTNTNTEPSLSAPDLRLTGHVESVTSVTPKTLKIPSAAVFNEGPVFRHGPYFSVSNSHVVSTVTTTPKILFKVRNPRVFQGVLSQVTMALQSLTISTSKSAGNVKSVFVITIAYDGTESATQTHTAVSAGNSVAYQASPAAGDGDTLSNYVTVLSLSAAAQSSKLVNLLDFNILLEPNRSLYVLYTNPDPSNNGSVDLEVALNWMENQ